MQNLNNQIPIVRPDGSPTDYFIRLMQGRGDGQDDIENTLAVLQETIVTKADKSIVLTAGTALSGGGDLSANLTFDLEDTAVTPGTYGDATNTPQLTVDQQGRITEVSNVAISGGGGSSTTDFDRPRFVLNASGSNGAFPYFFGRLFIPPQNVTINSIKSFVAVTNTTKITPGIYSVSGTGPGSLLGTGPSVTGPATGVRKFPLTTGVALTKDTPYFIGLQSEVAILNAYNTETSTSGINFGNSGALPATAPAATWGARSNFGFWPSTDT